MILRWLAENIKFENFQISTFSFQFKLLTVEQKTQKDRTESTLSKYFELKKPSYMPRHFNFETGEGLDKLEEIRHAKRMTPSQYLKEKIGAFCIFTDYIYVYNHSERCVGATIRPVVE